MDLNVLNVIKIDLIIGNRYKFAECKEYNLCEKCKEENSTIEEHSHNFIKIRKAEKNEDNINEIIEKEKEIPPFWGQKYSYECTTNKVNLFKYIYEGTDEAVIEIILKNNGEQTRPKGETKLIYDKESYAMEEDIILNPKNPEEKKRYEAFNNNLEKYHVGEYKYYLYSFACSKTFWEKLLFRIIIKEEEKKEILIIEDSDKV